MSRAGTGAWLNCAAHFQHQTTAKNNKKYLIKKEHLEVIYNKSKKVSRLVDLLVCYRVYHQAYLGLAGPVLFISTPCGNRSPAGFEPAAPRAFALTRRYDRSAIQALVDIISSLSGLNICFVCYGVGALSHGVQSNGTAAARRSG